MRQRNLRMLVGIVLVAAAAIFIALPTSPGIHLNLFGTKIDQEYPIHEGLDLKGGIQVLLQADVPAGTTVDQQSMQAAEFSSKTGQRSRRVRATRAVGQRQPHHRGASGRQGPGRRGQDAG